MLIPFQSYFEELKKNKKQHTNSVDKFYVIIVLHLWSFSVFVIIMCGLPVLWGGERKRQQTDTY